MRYFNITTKPRIDITAQVEAALDAKAEQFEELCKADAESLVREVYTEIGIELTLTKVSCFGQYSHDEAVLTLADLQAALPLLKWEIQEDLRRRDYWHVVSVREARTTSRLMALRR